VAAGTSEVPQVLAMEGMKVMLGGVSLCVCVDIVCAYRGIGHWRESSVRLDSSKRNQWK